MVPLMIFTLRMVLDDHIPGLGSFLLVGKKLSFLGLWRHVLRRLPAWRLPRCCGSLPMPISITVRGGRYGSIGPICPQNPMMPGTA